MGKFNNILLYTLTTLFVNILFIEKLHSQVPPNQIDLKNKIYSLSKVWSECEFNFPYFRFLDQNKIDSLFLISLDEVLHSSDDYTYSLVMRRFLASFKDNHTYYLYPQSIISQLNRSQFSNVKLEAKLIEGKAIITKTGKNNIYDYPVGSEILMMDSININIYIKKYILPYLSSSSEQRLNELGIRNIFLGVDNTSFLLTIKKPNGVIESHRLTRGDNQDDWYPVTKKTLFFSAVSKNICQIKIENFSDNRLADSINFYHRQLSQSAGIIVDIRGNSGGSSILASKIASYLIQDSVFLGSKVATRKNLAVNRAYGLRYPVSDTIYEYKKNDILFAKNLILENLGTSITQNIIDQKEKIIKPVVVLIDAQNISAAEEFLVYLNKQDNVTLIGEPTGGGNGLPMIIQLPDGGSASICTQYCAFPDGSDYYRNGIQPQIVVNQTFTDFLFGIDTVMEAAIKFLSYKINH